MQETFIQTIKPKETPKNTLKAIFGKLRFLKGPWFIPALMIISALAIGIAVQIDLAKNRRFEQARANYSYTGEVSIQPQENSLPPDANYRIYINPQNTPVVFASVEIRFDKSKIALASDPILSSTLQRRVYVTPTTDANNSGILNMVAAYDPAGTPPFKTFEFASLVFKSLTTDSSATPITVSLTDNTNLISEDGKPFSLAAVDSLAILNPTPEPSAAPPVTTEDTQNPTVSITFPTETTDLRRKNTVNLTANATDNGQVARVTFTVTGTKENHTCEDTATPYSCEWTIPPQPNETYTITVTAFDTSNNMANQTMIVNVDQF